jgi:hypothetical protein
MEGTLPVTSMKRHVIVALAAASIVALAAAGLVAGGMISRAATVRAALTSVLSHRTTVISMTVTHTVRGHVREYPESLVVKLTRGPRGPEHVELQVDYRHTPLGDVIAVGHTAYLRLDVAGLRKEFPKAYRDVVEEAGHPDGPDGILTRCRRSHLHCPASLGPILRTFADGGWLSVDGSAIRSAVKGETGPGAAKPPTRKELAELKAAAEFSIEQAWATFVSIRVVGSHGHTTEYAMSVPVRSFLASVASAMAGPVSKDLHIARADVEQIVRLVKSIPARLRIPIKVWVTSGEVRRILVSYRGFGIDLRISHPRIELRAPVKSRPLGAKDLENLAKLFLEGSVAIPGGSRPAAVQGLAGGSLLPAP